MFCIPVGTTSFSRVRSSAALVLPHSVIKAVRRRRRRVAKLWRGKIRGETSRSCSTRARTDPRPPKPCPSLPEAGPSLYPTTNGNAVGLKVRNERALSEGRSTSRAQASVSRTRSRSLPVS